MKMKKQVKARYKALAMVLSVLMVFAFMPAMTFAGTAETQADKPVTVGDGGTYDNVTTALNNVTSGGTIELESDVTEPDLQANGTQITLSDKDVTLDLNGHTLSTGKYSGTQLKTLFHVINGKTLTIDGTKAGSKINGTLYAGKADKNNGNIIINGGTYNATVENDCAIQSNGTCDNCIIKAKGATFTSTDDTFYLAGKGTYELDNCRVDGATGVYMKAGSLTVTGTTINATGDYAEPTADGNGANSTGDGIILDSKANYYGNMDLTLNSGNVITSTNGYAVKEAYTDATKTATHSIDINGGKYTGNADKAAYSVSQYFKDAIAETTSSFTIKGGSFSSDPTEYLAQGYVVSKSGSNYAVSAYIPPKTNTDTTTTPTGTVKTTTTTTPDITTTATGQVTATVSDTEASNILNSVKNAEAAGGDVATNVIIAGAGETGADQIHVSMPANMVSALATETKATVTVTTAVASVTMDQKALDAVASVAGGAGQVTLEVSNIAKSTLPATLQKELGDAVKILDVKLATPNGNVTNFNGGTVTINTQIPAAIPADDAACLYLDDDNNAFAVPGKVVKGANGEENYEFTTHHNSHYAIVTKENAEKAIAATTASQNAKTKKAVKATKVKLRKVKLSKKASAKKAKLNWKASGTVSLITYRVYRSVKKASGYKRIKTVKSTHYTFKKNAKKHYYYKVRAYKKIAGVNVYTNYSNILRI